MSSQNNFLIISNASCLCEHHDEAWLPIITRVFPHSKMIHLVKKPEGVMQSYLSKNLFSGRQVVPIDPAHGNKLQFKSLFVLVCWLFFVVNTYIHIHTRSLGPERFLFLNNEGLAAKNRDTFDTLCTFLNTPFNYDDFTDVFGFWHNSKAGRLGKFPELENWTPGLVQIFELFKDTYAHSWDSDPVST